MHYWGMHLFWWAFWLVILITFFATIEPVTRSKARLLRTRLETPLEILQRRFAAGEMTSEDYDARKATLQRDAIATAT